MMTNARRQLGMTLVEVIVAAAIALVGFLVALTIYQGARQAFKKGEQATDQQQETRVAYDRMMKDLRLAGYNWNATGDDRPGEEQIEGAWSGAITVRADYDFEDGTLSLDPENLIAGSTAKATVGNDEIVTFCLMKPDGTGGASLVFNADVDSSTTASSTLYGTVAARDGVTEAVTIPNVDLTQTSPPYNLYRVYRNNAKSPTSPGTVIMKDLLAENVKSLTFTYLDAAGNAITAPGGTETAADKATRASIKKINVTVVGMTSRPDPAYIDPADSNPLSQNYRKFSLTSQVTPRNIGFKGRADVDMTAPSIPTGLAVCPGHCGALLLTWNANPSNEAVSQYDLKWGTSAGTLTNVVNTSGTSFYLSGLTLGTAYYFALRAADASGNHSAYTSTISGTVNDGIPVSSPVTVPSAPAGFTGTGHGGVGGLNGQVNLAWTAVTTNAGALACDPTSPTLRDFGGYRLYRSETSTFTPASGDLIADEPASASALPKIPAAATSYSDVGAVNCRPYYYHLRAVDLTTCGNQSAVWAGAYDAVASSALQPAAPTGVTSARTGLTEATLTWNAVTQDTNSPAAPVTIDTYRIYRTQITNGVDPDGAGATYSLVGTTPRLPTTGTVTWGDSSAPPDQNGRKVYYKVSAVDDCPNESALSSASETLCNFNGAVAITPPNSPPSLNFVPQIVTITASGTDVYTSASLIITKSGGSQDFSQTLVATDTAWNFTWTPGQGGGTYNATAIVTNSAGCTASDTNTWTVVVAACTNCATVPRTDPVLGAAGSFTLQGNQINNTCAFPLQITQLQLREQSPTTCTHVSCATNAPMRLLRVQYKASGAFLNETTDSVVYTATAPGIPVSTTQTANIDLTATPLDLPSGTTARIRFVFNDTQAPIWVTTNNNRKHTLEGNFSFNQVTSLCSPASTGFIKLEITP